MYKKTAASHHFIPRLGSYSTRPHRNGRVDVLPPQAVESLWDVADQIAMLEARLASLQEQRCDLQLALHRADRLAQMQARLSGAAVQPNPHEAQLKMEFERIERQLIVTRVSLTDLNTALNPRSKQLTTDAAFVIVARLELDHDIYQSIAQKAERLIARTGHKVRRKLA